MDTIEIVEITVNTFLQSLGSWLIAPMRFFSLLGQEDFFFLVLPAIYWCIDTQAGGRVAIVLLLSTMTNGSLKLTFHLPRPYWISSAVEGRAFESEFGLPSGHAQISAALWGLLAVYARRRWVLALSLFMILMIGASRLVLGVHFLTDILAGWVLGFALLWSLLRIENQVLTWLRSRSFGIQVFLALLSAFAIILINYLILLSLRGWTIPPAWIEHAALANPDHPINPLSLAGIVNKAGLWFGATTGLAWLWKHGGYFAPGETWQLVTRYVLGMAGAILLWFGLSQALTIIQETFLFEILFLRSAIVGIWITALAPALFLKLQLATKSPVALSPGGTLQALP